MAEKECWIIPCDWSMYAEVNIPKSEYPTIESATRFLEEEAPLPEGGLVHNSFAVNYDMIPQLNE